MGSKECGCRQKAQPQYGIEQRGKNTDTDTDTGTDTDTDKGKCPRQPSRNGRRYTNMYMYVYAYVFVYVYVYVRTQTHTHTHTQRTIAEESERVHQEELIKRNCERRGTGERARGRETAKERAREIDR